MVSVVRLPVVAEEVVSPAPMLIRTRASYCTTTTPLPPAYPATVVPPPPLPAPPPVFALPFAQAAIVIAYFDIRVRKEAFDLEMMAAALTPKTPAA